MVSLLPLLLEAGLLRGVALAELLRLAPALLTDPVGLAVRWRRRRRAAAQAEQRQQPRDGADDQVPEPHAAPPFAASRRRKT